MVVNSCWRCSVLAVVVFDCVVLYNSMPVTIRPKRTGGGARAKNLCPKIDDRFCVQSTRKSIKAHLFDET